MYCKTLKFPIILKTYLFELGSNSQRMLTLQKFSTLAHRVSLIILDTALLLNSEESHDVWAFGWHLEQLLQLQLLFQTLLKISSSIVFWISMFFFSCLTPYVYFPKCIVRFYVCKWKYYGVPVSLWLWICSSFSKVLLWSPGSAMRRKEIRGCDSLICGHKI